MELATRLIPRLYSARRRTLSHLTRVQELLTILPSDAFAIWKELLPTRSGPVSRRHALKGTCLLFRGCRLLIICEISGERRQRSTVYDFWREGSRAMFRDKSGHVRRYHCKHLTTSHRNSQLYSGPVIKGLQWQRQEVFSVQSFPLNVSPH
jgi:hypothetical protein